jgi:hypothetical protein
MIKLLGRKYVIRIFPKYLATGRKLSKMVITREERPKVINPFQVFHASSRSTYDQKMESKRF